MTPIYHLLTATAIALLMISTAAVWAMLWPVRRDDTEFWP